MRRNLNRVCEYFKSTIPLYFQDEFKSHFRTTRETCELFTREVMPTGRIPLGNGSVRAAISPTKQVLAFLWSMANQEPTRAVEAMLTACQFRPRRNWARAFLLFEILGQRREVHTKFRNEIPENLLSIRSPPGISGIFGRLESGPCVLHDSGTTAIQTSCFCRAKIN